MIEISQIIYAALPEENFSKFMIRIFCLPFEFAMIFQQGVIHFHFPIYIFLSLALTMTLALAIELCTAEFILNICAYQMTFLRQRQM